MPTPLLIVAALQLLTLIAVAILYIRKPPAPTHDPRLVQLPDTLIRSEARLDARLEALDDDLRDGLNSLNAALRADLALHRNEAATHALTTRETHDRTSQHLREEVSASVARLATTLANGLESFRTDNRTADETLKTTVANDLAAIAQRLTAYISEANRTHIESREALHTRLSGLHEANAAHQEKLRTTVGDSLTKLNTDNAAKLEEMRLTVDEKLHATLHTRLTESFGQVTEQLNKVHTGLGEMSKLSEGVDGLSRIFTNVKSRGGFAEVQLGLLLEQILSSGQFIRNACVKPGTLQTVEFAVRFPSPTGESLLPIDAKFPREDWERLESAYASNEPPLLVSAGKAFENAIRAEGKRICEKYINAPVTTPYAIMFLPTEGLYAEVMRRSGLQAELQTKCHVTIAGPATLFAILTSFRMGFQLLNMQAKGDEVWRILESAKTEFGKFGSLVDKVENDVGKIQKSLGEVGVRTRAINRSLSSVSDHASATPQLLAFEDFTGVVPLLAATEGED